MVEKKKQVTRTGEREKLAVWCDNEDVTRLRALQEKYGIPVSNLIRWFIHDGLENKRHPVQR